MTISVNRYWAYSRYVVRHKWHVFHACRALGVPLLGVLHDWSKFLPNELIPYARHFYGPDGTKRDVRNKTGYYKPTETGDAAFDEAWFWHSKRNKHHWLYWCIPTDDGGVLARPMPERYAREMVADWRGAGLAQGKPDIGAWYAENGHRMTLHPETRAFIESLLARG